MENYIDRCHKALEYITREKDYYKACLTLTPRSQWAEVTEDDAKTRYAILFYTHLSRGEYEEAAAMVLPKHRFNLRAKSARRVWNLCFSEKRLLIMGAGAVGKTFTIGVWTLLDWLRDPEHTLVNVVSTTKKHARANLFGDLCGTWKAINNIVPLVGEVSSEKISVDPSSDTAGIFLVGIAEGDQGVGRLRGLHPKPRMEPHPIFGNLTRTRTLLDEAGEIPRGIWSDLRNAFITQEGEDPERIKILGASNPEDPNSEYGQRCEPKGGWVNHDDESEEWDSMRGWRIYRIDAAKTENVVNRKMIIEGMQTYEGYLAAMADAGGEGSPGYWIMCRGMFPPSGHGSAIVTNALLQRARGEWIFDEIPTEIFSLDSALEGGDLPILSYGRFGLARKALIDGEEITIHEKARNVIQVDFQIPLGKGDSVKVAENCRDELPNEVNPFWVAIDGTGSGDGVLSAMRRFIGSDILAVIYSESPTDTRIMADDDRTAKQAYRNIRAEMWYSMRRWLESRLIMFADQCDVELYRELSGVRGGLIGGKYVVEKKEKYKSRNRGRSPDHAESAIQLVHLVRVRGDVEAGLFEDKKESYDWEDRKKLLDPLSTVDYMDTSTN